MVNPHRINERAWPSDTQSQWTTEPGQGLGIPRNRYYGGHWLSHLSLTLCPHTPPGQSLRDQELRGRQACRSRKRLSMVTTTGSTGPRRYRARKASLQTARCFRQSNSFRASPWKLWNSCWRTLFVPGHPLKQWPVSQVIVFPLFKLEPSFLFGGWF